MSGLREHNIIGKAFQLGLITNTTGTTEATTTISHLDHEFTALRYLSTSAFVIWIWDTLITLDEEILLVWGPKRTIVKVLYVLVSLFIDLPARVSSILDPLYHDM